MDDLLMILGGVALFTAWAAFAGFMLLFHTLAEWRSSDMGRHIMVFMGVITLILTYVMVVYLTSNSVVGGYRAWVRVMFYGALGWVGWWRVMILIRTQRESRQRKTVVETLEGTRNE